MELLLNQSGKKIFLLGNEAIVRGALEAGVQFVSTYPGTPASEIGNTFFRLSQKGDYKGYFEFSTNEKVALESAIGASFSGLKTLVAMKNFGLNVCLDSLFPFVYTGAKGPTVIVVADDPSCHSSAQSEENTRGFGELLHIPILEPADPQEAKDFMLLAFQISEKFNMPVILRTTTRVAHQSMPVKLGVLNSPGMPAKGKFVKDFKRFVTLPPRVLEMKEELLDKIGAIERFSDKNRVNHVEGRPSKIGIITSGVSYLYVKEALKELALDLPVLKLGFFYPLPKEKIGNFIEGLKKVLIVEELEPFLERETERLAKEINCKLEIVGKELLPATGELRPEIVTRAIADFANKKYQSEVIDNKLKVKHLPRFCPGCPYWQVFAAIKKTLPEDTVFGGDIGCYMLSGLPPHNLQDYLFSMGSSIGIAHGIVKAGNPVSAVAAAGKKKAVAFIGDSTFCHAGVPALINAVFNKSNILVIILDNQTTAMTGHQPNPAIASRENSKYQLSFTDPDFAQFSEAPGPTIKLEELVRACGIKEVSVVDSLKPEEMMGAIKEHMAKDEASVIIARSICVLLAKGLKKD